MPKPTFHVESGARSAIDQDLDNGIRETPFYPLNPPSAKPHTPRDKPNELAVDSIIGLFKIKL